MSYDWQRVVYESDPTYTWHRLGLTRGLPNFECVLRSKERRHAVLAHLLPEVNTIHPSEV
jgi:hypothetical protein